MVVSGIFTVWFLLVFCSLAQAQPNRCAQFVTAPHGFNDTKLTAEQIYIRPLHFKNLSPRNKYSLRNGPQSNHVLDVLPPTDKEFRLNLTDKFSPLPGDLYQVDILKSNGNLESFQLLLPVGHGEMLSEFKQTLVDYVPEEFIGHLGIVRLNPQPFTKNPSLAWPSKGLIEKALKTGYLVNYTASQKNLRRIPHQKASVIEIFDTLSSADHQWPRRLAEALAYNFLQRAIGTEKNNFEFLAPLFDVNVHRNQYYDLAVAQKLAQRIHKGFLSIGAKAFLRYLHPRQTVTAPHPAQDFSEVAILVEDRRHYQAYYQDLYAGHTIPILLKGNLTNIDEISLEILRYHLQKIVERLPHRFRQFLELTIELDPTISVAQAVKSTATARNSGNNNLILKFSPDLLRPDGKTLNATTWATLIGGVWGEQYNEDFLAARQLSLHKKSAAMLDSRGQFWANAKSKAWQTIRTPATHWYSLPKIWRPTYRRLYGRSVTYNPVRSYTAKNADRQNVIISFHTQKLLVASKKVRYVTSVSTPADLSPGLQAAVEDVVRETLAALPAEIPFIQGIKILPKGLYPYTSNLDVTLRPTTAMANFKSYYNNAQKTGVPNFDYYEDIIIGNFLSNDEMLNSAALAAQIRYGIATIINNGLCKDGPHAGYPDDDFLALLPPLATEQKQDKFARRERFIKAISYYLEHRFVPNYHPQDHKAYQDLFNFLDKFFVAREATYKKAAAQINLTSIRTSQLWKLLPIIYEEQIRSSNGPRSFDLIAPDLAFSAASPSTTFLQFADLGDVTALALDQFRYGLDAFMADRHLTAADFLPLIAEINVTTEPVPPEASKITGKVLSGHPSFLGIIDVVVSGRHHVTFYLEKELFHTKIGEAKVLFTRAWKELFPQLKNPPTDAEGEGAILGRMFNDWFEY